MSSCQNKVCVKLKIVGTQNLKDWLIFIIMHKFVHLSKFLKETISCLIIMLIVLSKCSYKFEILKTVKGKADIFKPFNTM